ncbi:hypothetical protein P692DRAFT_20833953 [Suillus brevipes Sb2]|nr:hypothetical protein P692DRAFT_20833953 [Suillus brevipes Sb2]
MFLSCSGDYDLSLTNDLFMVLDYSTEEGWRGEVKHLYRHDLESFKWVFAWIAFASRRESSDQRNRATSMAGQLWMRHAGRRSFAYLIP